MAPARLNTAAEEEEIQPRERGSHSSPASLLKRRAEIWRTAVFRVGAIRKAS